MEQEVGLEPPREASPGLPAASHDTEMEPEPVHLANRLRGGAEEPLSQKPFIVKFPSPKAGA
ncbi:hypothetical protein H0H81_004415, partial [Sphagnurus paluster]